MNKQLEEAIKHLKNGKKISMIELLRTLKREGTEKFCISRKEYVDTVLKELERLQEDYIPKNKIREKIIIDKSKLNNCTNSIFGNICKARIEFGQELLEGNK